MIADGFDWHFERSGSKCGPSLLLLHGFSGCLEFWSDIVIALAPQFDTIAIDLPGHGKTHSVSKSPVYSMDKVARSLTGFMNSIGLSRCHLWGYSMGGRLALYLAIHFPQFVDCLVLESTSPGIYEESERADRCNRDNDLADRMAEVSVSTFVREWMDRPLFASQKRLAADKQRRAHDLRCQNSVVGLGASLRGMGTGMQQPLHDRLSMLTLPTLVLTGELDTKFCAIGEMMSSRMLQSQHRVIAEAGHAPHWERPEACVSLVQSFLTGQIA